MSKAFFSSIVVAILAVTLSACERSASGGLSAGINGGNLSNGAANVWIDPEGCLHWYIDDGVEGYMTPRMNRDGTPKCRELPGQIAMKDGMPVYAEPEPVRPGT